MAFQIYETGSLQVTTGSGVVMDPGGLFVASNWNGATNIHPLSSSADIYKNNGPIGESYYAICDGVNDTVNFNPHVFIDDLKNGFDSEGDNRGSGAGITYSWWWKTFDTSNHWDNMHINSSAGNTTYYAEYGFFGAGGLLANISGVFLTGQLDNDWHHFVATHDSGSQKTYIYIDNTLIFEGDSTNVNIPISTTEQIQYIKNFSGAIDEWAFCHKFLHPSDFAPFGKPINLMKKKDELKLKAYLKFGDGIEQASGSNVHSLVNGAGSSSTGSYFAELQTGAHIGSASADLLKNSGKVVNFNV